MINKLLVGVFVLSLSLNVYQATAVATAKQDAERVLARHSLAVGDPVPPLTVESLSGEAVTFAYDQHGARPTVFYFFAPDCVWCLANESSVRELALAAKHSYSFVGIATSTTGLKDYAGSHDLGFPIYAMKKTAQEYKVLGTPTTIAVSPEGRVIGNWRGAYRASTRSGVETFFDVDLSR